MGNECSGARRPSDLQADADAVPFLRGRTWQLLSGGERVATCIRLPGRVFAAPRALLPPHALRGGGDGGDGAPPAALSVRRGETELPVRLGPLPEGAELAFLVPCASPGSAMPPRLTGEHFALGGAAAAVDGRVRPFERVLVGGFAAAAAEPDVFVVVQARVASEALHGAAVLDCPSAAGLVGGPVVALPEDGGPPLLLGVIGAALPPAPASPAATAGSERRVSVSSAASYLADGTPARMARVVLLDAERVRRTLPSEQRVWLAAKLPVSHFEEFAEREQLTRLTCMRDPSEVLFEHPRSAAVAYRAVSWYRLGLLGKVQEGVLASVGFSVTIGADGSLHGGGVSADASAAPQAGGGSGSGSTNASDSRKKVVFVFERRQNQARIPGLPVLNAAGSATGDATCEFSPAFLTSSDYRSLLDVIERHTPLLLGGAGATGGAPTNGGGAGVSVATERSGRVQIALEREVGRDERGLRMLKGLRCEWQIDEPALSAKARQLVVDATSAGARARAEKPFAGSVRVVSLFVCPVAV